MTLDLALITHGPDGVYRIVAQNLPEVPGVRYVVSWQNHGDAPVPPELIRHDVVIFRLDLSGLSNNRNNALEHCEADIVLFAEDDVVYDANGLMSLIRAYEEHPHADFITGLISRPFMPEYPKPGTKLLLPLPRNYYIGSCEISFRRSSVGHLRCHPELGLGSPRMHGGEDEIFLLAAIRQGLNCIFLPIHLGDHPSLSTGCKLCFTNANLRAFGCVIALYTGWESLARIPLKAWRLWRQHKASLARALIYMISGGVRSVALRRKRDRRYLW